MNKCLNPVFGKKIRVMKENSNSQKTELTIDVDMGTAPVIKAQNDDMGTPLIKRAQHDCMDHIKAQINAHCAAKSLSKSNANLRKTLLEI
jgi:Ethanolamine utilization protein EutJ (predicted chaperonin)